jgi:cation transport ATPase
MRFLLQKRKDGRTTVNWLMLLGCVVMVPVVVIAAVEVFWYKFTGGFSTLMGLFALVAAILIVIRLVGETLMHRSRMSASFP